MVGAGWYVDRALWLFLIAHVLILSAVFAAFLEVYYIKDGMIVMQSGNDSNNKIKYDHQLIRLITKITCVQRDGKTVALKLYRNEYEKDARILRLESTDAFLQEILEVDPNIPVETETVGRWS